MWPYSPLWRLHTIGYRNHRKIAVIDGTVGYAGGLNIGEEHIEGSAKLPFWRDTHVRIAGAAAPVLQAAFAVDWQNAVGEELLVERYFPMPEEKPRSKVPVQITLSGPDSEWQAIRQLYFKMIVTASRHVYIQSPFFILDDSIAEAIKAAALAGIDVRIMLSDRGMSQFVPYWAANTYIAQVEAAGAKVYIYKRGYLHAKTISVDSIMCSIGSANIDIRSFSINYELNAVIYDPEVSKKLETDFLRDLKDCTEFKSRDYRKWPWLLRFRDSVARLFSPLL
jgi:cardiolipin synthase